MAFSSEKQCKTQRTTSDIENGVTVIEEIDASSPETDEKVLKDLLVQSAGVQTPFQLAAPFLIACRGC